MQKALKNLYTKFKKANLYVQFIIAASTILIIIGPYFILTDKNEKEAFKKTTIAIGIVENVIDSHSQYGSTHRIFFEYETSKKEKFKAIENSYGHPCIEYRKRGDTIVIEYSTVNNKYARVISCYWNDNIKKKYGF